MSSSLDFSTDIKHYVVGIFVFKGPRVVYLATLILHQHFHSNVLFMLRHLFYDLKLELYMIINKIIVWFAKKIEYLQSTSMRKSLSNSLLSPLHLPYRIQLWPLKRKISCSKILKSHFYFVDCIYVFWLPLWSPFLFHNLHLSRVFILYHLYPT